MMHTTHEEKNTSHTSPTDPVQRKRQTFVKARGKKTNLNQNCPNTALWQAQEVSTKVDCAVNCLSEKTETKVTFHMQCMRTPDKSEPAYLRTPTRCADYCTRLWSHTLPTSGQSTGQLWQSEWRRLADQHLKTATWIQLSHAKPHCRHAHSSVQQHLEGHEHWSQLFGIILIAKL